MEKYETENLDIEDLLPKLTKENKKILWIEIFRLLYTQDDRNTLSEQEILFNSKWWEVYF